MIGIWQPTVMGRRGRLRNVAPGADDVNYASDWVNRVDFSAGLLRRKARVWLTNRAFAFQLDVPLPMNSSQAERRTVHFVGQVQGVGFRYATRNIARNLAVTGFVRNLADGRVQLVVEGDRKVLDQFIDQIKQSMAAYIREQTVDEQSSVGEFTTFEIRH